MADYWKSNARHMCPICNVWMAGDKASIRHHESGNKHKYAVQDSLRKKRDEKYRASRDESQLQKDLRKIEAAAAKAHARDGSHFEPSQVAATAAHPRDSGRAHHSSQRISDLPVAGVEGGEGESENGPPPPNVEEEDSGRYQIGDKWYLDGKKHEEMLIKGKECEIFQEEQDEWVPAEISEVKVVVVPSVDLTIRRFEIKCQGTLETDVLSDRLRLVLSESEAQEEARKNGDVVGATAVLKAEPPPPVNEATGFGGWQTVSVREVDVEAERRQREDAAIKKEMKDALKAAAVRREQELEEAMDADDAMASYDPWGTGTYKGMKIEDVASSAGGQPLLDGADGTTFKKRKAPGGKFKRRRRDDGDD